MFKAPRGTQDILPSDQPYWGFVEQQAVETSRLYGYQRLATPAFEDYGLFARSVGEATDIVSKEMYTFEDRSGNMLALRPEGTAPICRAYIEHGMHSLPQPVKLYYLAPLFRYERPQAGRYRQHHQFGFEAIGEADPALDAEVIDMAWAFYRSLGLTNLTLQLNSIGCRACRPAYFKALKEYYADKIEGLCPDCKTRFEKNPLRLLDCKEAACQTVADAAPSTTRSLCEECGNHLKQLQRYLLALGLSFQYNHRLVRGLDYYTKTVFEVQSSEAGAQSAVGGGGRYDNLIEDLGGKPTPAIGFATGIERIIHNLTAANIAPPPAAKPAAYVVFLGDKARLTAMEIAASLRRAGVPVVASLSNKSLKAGLKHADNSGAHHAIIIGEDELEKGTATIRDMLSGEQSAVPVGELAARFKKG